MLGDPQAQRIKSTAYNEKKKNPTPPPRIPIHAAICLILLIINNF